MVVGFSTVISSAGLWWVFPNTNDQFLSFCVSLGTTFVSFEVGVRFQSLFSPCSFFFWPWLLQLSLWQLICFLMCNLTWLSWKEEKARKSNTPTFHHRFMAIFPTRILSRLSNYRHMHILAHRFKLISVNMTTLTTHFDIFTWYYSCLWGCQIEQMSFLTVI